jgi:threonine/homoserine/homoserine lactone efflux protein
MPNHFESKTMAGLALLLLVVVGLTLFGKLTPEAVDAIKWIGGSFMTVRAAANIMEGKNGQALGRSDGTSK